MTRRKKKILIWIGAGLPALLLVLIIASVLIIRTAWFAEFVRDKIIAATEESTGGVVEIGAGTRGVSEGAPLPYASGQCVADSRTLI